MEMYKAEGKGKFWNGNDIYTVKLNGQWYVLDGWNGERYTDCWAVKDEEGLNRVNSDIYEISPVERENKNGDFEVIGYEVR